mgnify:CR=1 FL=1|jgi:hypothetical protein
MCTDSQGSQVSDPATQTHPARPPAASDDGSKQKNWRACERLAVLCLHMLCDMYVCVHCKEVHPAPKIQEIPEPWLEG